MEFQVLLTSVADVKEFADAAAEYPYDVDVQAGRYLVNGKSIMGLFSVDLSVPVAVRLQKDGPEAEEMRARLEKFVP